MHRAKLYALLSKQNHQCILVGLFDADLTKNYEHFGQQLLQTNKVVLFEAEEHLFHHEINIEELYSNLKRRGYYDVSDMHPCYTETNWSELKPGKIAAILRHGAYKPLYSRSEKINVLFD